MRASRIVYVENDPALLGIMSTLLGQHAEIDLLLATDSVDEVLEHVDAIIAADAALLDLALGSTQMNGVDLGLALRAVNANIGVVLHSQYSLQQVERRIPERERMGWSTVPKSGQMAIDALVDVIRLTARGMSRHVPQDDAHDTVVLTRMTTRQRSVMALSSSGVSGPEIARRLGISYDAVRQDLSKAYKLLVPRANAGDDVRTLAILEYLRRVREASWDAE